MQHWDLNAQALEHESPPIITRQGLQAIGSLENYFNR